MKPKPNHHLPPERNPRCLMTRRDFLLVTGSTALACASVLPPGTSCEAATPTSKKLPEPRPAHLPRWRGFNLLEKFTHRPEGNPPFSETDFEWIAEWGFDFVRLPMSYLCWSEPQDWLKLREEELKHIDQAVELGRKYGVHVNINFHRAPGYCVNPPKEPLDLWSDEKALEACAFHWAQFAKRYRGIPSSRVSFDLLNEPADLPEPAYTRVVKRLVEGIRSEDPKRLILADGLKWGTQPVPSLAGLGIAQSTRGYSPTRISHWKANWMRGSDQWPEPSWPLTIKAGDVWDQDRLRKEHIEPWQALEGQGVGIHVGEWGAFQHTPHKVALAWMRDWLELWKKAGWGWAMWNFRGPFGILDSKRADVTYENWHGHQLDRQMLELIRTY